MSKGLISKWADEDDLIVEAKTQDHVPIPNATSKPVVSKPVVAAVAASIAVEQKPKKSTKLESRWAVSSDEEEPKPASTMEFPRGPKGRGNKASRGREKRGSFNSQLRTPPSSREADDVKEDRPPMSAAAMSFASRLGTEQRDQREKGHSKSESKEHFKSQEHFKQQNQYPKHPKTPKPTKHSEHTDSEEELPQMTSGNALAARLGMSSSTKPSSKPVKPSTPTTEAPAPKGKYVPPKQKRLLEEKAKREEQARVKQEQVRLKEKQEEEERSRYKDELDKLVKEMEDSNLNWADIDD